MIRIEITEDRDERARMFTVRGRLARPGRAAAITCARAVSFERAARTAVAGLARELAVRDVVNHLLTEEFAQ